MFVHAAPAPQRGATYVLNNVEDICGIVMGNFFDEEMRAILLDDPWYEKFITSIHTWVNSNGRALTTEQARVCLKVIQKTKPLLVSRGWATDEEIDRLLARPRYNRTPIPSTNYPREARYLGDNLLGFRFKRKDTIVFEIKNMIDEQGSPVASWDWSSRLWIIPVLETTLAPIMKLIGKHNFGFTDEVAEYLALSTNSVGEPSTFTIGDDGTIHATIRNDTLMSKWVHSVLGGTIR